MEQKKMKAIVCTKYGSPDYLQLKEVNRPTPKENEVLVKVHASTTTTADTMMRRAEPFISRLFLGFTKPRNDIMGTGFAGKVVAVGSAVRDFNPGDAVFGETGVNFGANAEYVCVPEDGLILRKPTSMSFEEAATICDGPLTSWNFMKELANIQAGQRVLINGASGSLGTAAVQLAKYFGAEVTGVCGPASIALVKSLGADHVIDYTLKDFTKGASKYHVIYDTVGKSSFARSKKVLTENGTYLSPVLNLTLLFQMMFTAIFGTKKALFSATGLRPVTELLPLLQEITKLMASGHLKTIIDKRFPLEKTAEAHRYVDTGHKKGNVVIVLA